MNKKLLLSLSVLLQMGVYAQTALFSPTSNIATYGSVSSPAAEQVAKIIDGNVNTKFLDFNYTDGIGFTVNLNGTLKTASSMAFTTANDFPQRDPMNYQIFGSTNGTTFALITSGNIVCNPNRFNTTTYDFENTESYSYYRFVFTNQCNTSEAMFQIAEVQLFQNPLSSASFTSEFDFQIYPNPTSGSVFIKNPTNSTIDFVTIINNAGQEVQTISAEKLIKNTIDLAGLVSGIYFVQITAGNKSVVKKISRQ